MKKKDYLEKVLATAAMLSFAALLCVVFLQVFSRFMLPKTPSWTEEASRFLFIYSIAFSAPLALKRNEFVKVDILTSKFPKEINKILEEIVYLLISLFFLIVSINSVAFAELGVGQISATLYLPMILKDGEASKG